MQNPAHASLYASALSAEFSDFENAARYALLQRLMPAIRHHMMGKFQSMGMIAALMERRLLSDAPDLASLREDCASLGSVSRAAASSTLNLMTWIQPQSAATLNVNAGIMECLSLLSTDLRFKGFVILNEVPEIDVAISSTALRSVLSAALMALSDLSEAPADLVIRAQFLPDRVELSIDRRPAEGRAKSIHLPENHPLTWRDAEILAIAESVKLTRGKDGVQLSFSRLDGRLPDDGTQRPA